MDFTNKKAIILSECGKIKRSLTYEDVRNIKDLIVKFITEHVERRNVCIGLQMTHNIYVPSLVLSLQELQHPFIFLPENTADSKSVTEALGVTWVLSFTNSVNCVAKVALNHDDDLFLEKYPKVQSKDYENIYFIIRTSGTTGENKFVKVKKFCIQSNVNTLSRIFKITQNDVIYFGTPLTFDPSMIELFLALDNRACLLITPPKIRINSTLLYQTLFHVQNGVTVLQMVPSLFLRWSHEQIASILQLPLLKILALGGEQFPETILQHPKTSSLRIFNLYGITEVSCWASINEVQYLNNEKQVSIGDALEDTIVQVRDEYGNQITTGEGEIYVGSSTRICLVDVEQQTLETTVFRATGDIATVVEKKIYYSGRKNDTFKRFGHKLHLSRIEDVIWKETGLENKCVWSKKLSKLLVFLILEQYERNRRYKILDKVRVKLVHTLPEYCFPDYIDIIRKCPLTVHGKIDKNTLENIFLKQDNTDKNLNSLDTFRSLICKYFGFGQCQLENLAKSSFFDIGGTSVLAVQLLNELSDQLAVESSELTTALFEKDLNACFECLANVQKTQKRTKILENHFYSKKVRKETELKIAWTYNLHACVDSSPLVFYDGHRIVVAVGSFSHIFAVIDDTTGSEISKFILPDVIESTPCLSPCRNYLYTGCFDGKIYCLDWKNNEIVWSYTTGDRIKCSPILCQESAALVFGSYDKHVHCISIQNGTLLWKIFTSESLISTPLLHGGKIFVATICGTCLCLSESDGSIVWSYKTGSPIFGSPCIYRDLVVWPNVQGKIVCLTTTGEVKWQYECGGHLYSSLLNHDDLIIFGCHDENLYVLSIESIIATMVSLGDKISGTPCIGKVGEKKCVFVATDGGTMFAVDFEGFVIGEIKLPGQVFSSVRFLDGRVYLGCRDNNVYCISC